MIACCALSSHAILIYWFLDLQAGGHEIHLNPHSILIYWYIDLQAEGYEMHSKAPTMLKITINRFLAQSVTFYSGYVFFGPHYV